MFVAAGIPFEACILAEFSGIPVSAFNCGADGNSILQDLYTRVRPYIDRARNYLGSRGIGFGSSSNPVGGSSMGIPPGGAGTGVPGTCSFTPDTPVSTADGEVSIGEIEVGDQVYAWNEASDAVSLYMVTDTFSHPDQIIVTLVIDGETITTTPEHPF